MRRAGHEVEVFNPATLLRSGWVIDRARPRLGYRSSRNGIARALERRFAGKRYDAIWVGGGMQLGAAAVDRLRRNAPLIVNYNTDDPWGGRDGHRWDSYLQAVPEYDLVVVVRRPNVGEAVASGARQVLRVWMTFDEIVHRPQTLSQAEVVALQSDIAFLGTWMPERGPILSALVKSGFDVAIWGNMWQRAPEWPALSRAWRGPALPNTQYSKALQSTKVAIGLLSKGNRDLHTQRSVEVPAIGTLLCAERTEEHEQVYGERGALLWQDNDECIDRCVRLLADDAARARVAERGQQRVRGYRLSNEPMVDAVLVAASRQAQIQEWPPELAAPTGPLST
jgi:spore maturation protein CgeB